MSSTLTEVLSSTTESRDSDLFSLIAALTLEDVEELQKDNRSSIFSSPSSANQDTLSDEELAVQLYAEEANSLLLFAQDAALAYSIQEALRTDRSLIREMVRQETQETRDHRMALALHAGRHTPEPAFGAPKPEDPDLFVATDDSESEELVPYLSYPIAQ